MKKLLTVCLILVLACTVAVTTVIANSDYTGTMEELSALVNSVDNSADASVEEAVVAVADYIAQNPVDPSSQGYTEAMNKVYTKAIAYAVQKVAEAKTKSDVEAKGASLASVAAVISPFEIPAGFAGYSALMKEYLPEALICAEMYLASCDVTQGTARNGVAVNKVNAFVKLHPSVLDDASFKTEYEVRKKAQQDAVDALIDGFNASNSLDNYNLGVLINEDFKYDDPNGLYGFTQTINIAGNNTLTRHDGVDGDYNYLLFSFYDSNHSYIRTDLPRYDYGTVIEFDITTFGHLPENGIEIGSSSATNASGGRFYPGYGSFNAKGDFFSKDKMENGSGTIINGAIVPGEWLHISMVFHPETGLLDYYVNYEYISSCDATAGNKGTHNMHCFRIGSINNVAGCEDPTYDGDFAVANVQIYQGDRIRSVDLFKEMTIAERFVYYVNYLYADIADVIGKKTAYDMSAELLENYWDGRKYLTTDAEICKAVDDYLLFDYDELYSKYQAQKLDEFVAMVEDLVTIERKIDNYTARQAAADNVEKFLKNVGNNILKDERYTQYFDMYLGVVALAKMDLAVNDFCRYVDRVFLAFAAAPMQKHYNTCAELLKSIDLNLLNNPNFVYFAEQYQRFLSAADELYARIGTENAKKIVECVNIISEYDTVKEWDENYAYVNKYILIIRSSVASGNVDESYEGLDEALEFFNKANSYFYGKLQAEHIAHIKDRIEAFAEAESYVEKMGICAYLNNYFADVKNDIDMTNPDIVSLKTSVDIYTSEMEARKQDYKYLLEQNTVFFTNAIKKMVTATDYNTKKAFYDEATSYYFAMNVGDETIKEYLDYYDAATVELEYIRVSSEKFVENVAILIGKINDPKVSKDELFKDLINCYVYRTDVAVQLDGVAEAIEVFDALYSTFENAATVSNGEVCSAGYAVIALRSNISLAPILSTLYGIMYGA